MTSGDIVETGVKDEPYLLCSEHTECYKTMGLTNQALEEYTRTGCVVWSISYIPGLGACAWVTFRAKSRFYQHKSVLLVEH